MRIKGVYGRFGIKWHKVQQPEIKPVFSRDGAAVVVLGKQAIVVKEYPRVMPDNIERYLMRGLS